jgi:hypothetical protein
VKIWIGLVALGISACGGSSNGALTLAGIPGTNTSSFTIDTEQDYTVLLAQTDVSVEGCATTYCPPTCVITASFSMGNTNFTITAHPRNIKEPGFPPSYVTSAMENHHMTAGTWNYTAVAQCGFDINIYTPSTPSP